MCIRDRYQRRVHGLAKKGEWDECLELASKQSADIFNHYMLAYAKKLIGEGNFKETAEMFVKYKCPLSPANLSVYKTLALEILADTDLKDSELVVLKHMMVILCRNMESNGNATNNPVYDEFVQYATIAHLELLKAETKALNMQKNLHQSLYLLTEIYKRSKSRQGLP
eukprot:TRINITY_DN6017_c0_g1_i2.p1 TRINITY_DN6017_c0_g1~~TRINITY_DN6017_c0_g1_i2.p1  ORF type:complete len:184 (-),score=23.86 TRINITY_DN6017_c0_g1_i2:568-1071(-)